MGYFLQDPICFLLTVYRCGEQIAVVQHCWSPLFMQETKIVWVFVHFTWEHLYGNSYIYCNMLLCWRYKTSSKCCWMKIMTITLKTTTS